MVRKELLKWEILTLLVTFGDIMCSWVCVNMSRQVRTHTGLYTHTHTHTHTHTNRDITKAAPTRSPMLYFWNPPKGPEK